LQLAPIVFVQQGDFRHAEWSEINFETADWRISAEKMKTETLHIVPLSLQAFEVLRKIQPLTGQGRYVFPNPRTELRPMSDNAILVGTTAYGVCQR
jgi:integrase